jgi:hypothetical protein
MLFNTETDEMITGTHHGREYAQHPNRILGTGMSEEKATALLNGSDRPGSKYRGK